MHQTKGAFVDALGNEQGKRRIGSGPDKDAVLTTGTETTNTVNLLHPRVHPTCRKCAKLLYSFFFLAWRSEIGCFFFFFFILLYVCVFFFSRDLD
jgi:hypothetical protein